MSMQALSGFCRALVSIRNPEELCEKIVEAISEAFPVIKIALVLQEEQRGKFSVKAAKGLSREFYEGCTFDPYGGIPLWFRRNSSLLITDRIDSSSSIEEQYTIRREAELTSGKLFAPLLHAGRLIGFLSLGNKYTGESFSYEDLGSIHAFAQHAAEAIHNSLSYQSIDAQRENLEGLVQNSEIGIIATDASGTIIAYNHAAGKVTGISAMEAIGKHVELFNADFADALTHATRTGQSLCRKRIAHPAKQERLEATISVLKNREQKPVGAVMVFADGVENGSDALKDVSMMMQHHVRGALTSISAFGQMLGEHSDNAELIDKADSLIKKPSRRLVRVVDKLSDYADFSDLLPTDNNLEDLMKGLIHDFREDSNKEGVAIHFESTLQESRGAVDGEKIMAAIGEILENSMEAVEEKENGKAISVNIRNHTSNGGTYKRDFFEIAISDNGKGIADTMLDKVFEPFYTTKWATGIGLGLPITQRIIEQHDGSIQIMSVEGEGTLVSIRLPREFQQT
jgi:PAS domain S-box-containing protein